MCWVPSHGSCSASCLSCPSISQVVFVHIPHQLGCIFSTKSSRIWWYQPTWDSSIKTWRIWVKVPPPCLFHVFAHGLKCLKWCLGARTMDAIGCIDTKYQQWIYVDLLIVWDITCHWCRPRHLVLRSHSVEHLVGIDVFRPRCRSFKR